jgi:hypothetical protein
VEVVRNDVSDRVADGGAVLSDLTPTRPFAAGHLRGINQGQPVETNRSMLSVELQELDVVCHLLRREDLGNQHRAADDQPDACIGRREHDAGVRHSSGVQAQMIGIGSDQDPAMCCCKREQRTV